MEKLLSECAEAAVLLGAPTAPPDTETHPAPPYEPEAQGPRCKICGFRNCPIGPWE